MPVCAQSLDFRAEQDISAYELRIITSFTMIAVTFLCTQNLFMGMESAINLEQDFTTSTINVY